MRTQNKKADSGTQVVPAAQLPAVYGTSITKNKKAYLVPKGFRYCPKQIYDIDLFLTRYEADKHFLAEVAHSLWVWGRGRKKIDKQLSDFYMSLCAALLRFDKAVHFPDPEVFEKAVTPIILIGNSNRMNQDSLGSLHQLYELREEMADAGTDPLIVVLTVILKRNTDLKDGPIWDLIDAILFLVKTDPKYCPLPSGR